MGSVFISRWFIFKIFIVNHKIIISQIASSELLCIFLESLLFPILLFLILTLFFFVYFQFVINIGFKCTFCIYPHFTYFISLHLFLYLMSILKFSYPRTRILYLYFLHFCIFVKFQIDFCNRNFFNLFVSIFCLYLYYFFYFLFMSISSFFCVLLECDHGRCVSFERFSNRIMHVDAYCVWNYFIIIDKILNVTTNHDLWIAVF